MRKLYTYNHKNLTVHNDFEIKFESYLNYLKGNDIELYNSFMGSNDFKIDNLHIFKIQFEEFLDNWLNLVFNFRIETIEKLRNEIETVDDNFDEFFAYYNFHKKMTSKECNELSIYDITLSNEEKELLRKVFLHETINQGSDILGGLIKRSYISIKEGKILPEFKTNSIKGYLE